MAAPVKPNLNYSYTGFQQEQQDFPFPGTQLDADLAELKRATDDTIDALADVRRADGKLVNEIVTMDALAPQLRLQVGRGEPGASAYELAVADGFDGTEQQWLDSLHGSDGSPGTPGAPGQDGITPNFTIGTVTTLSPGSGASVDVTGTAEEPVLNFGIPRGDTGASGEGTGDVVGPSGATDNELALFDGDTGTAIKGSGVFASDFATSAQGALAESSIQRVTSRAALASLSTADDRQVLFDGSQWIPNFSDLSSLVEADPAQGIFVPFAADDTGASGAWVRQNEGVLNPEWFGATAISRVDLGNSPGTLPDSTAALAGIASLISAVPVYSLNLHGFYRTTAPIVINAPNIHITGSGHQVSGILFHNCDGFQIEQTNRFDTLRVSGIAILSTSGVGADRTGIYYENTDSVSGNQGMKQIDNCFISGLDVYLAAGVAANLWVRCVHAVNADRTAVLSCILYGPTQHWAAGTGGVWPVQSRAILAEDCTHIILSHSHVYYMETALYCTGLCEGPAVFETAVVACNRGFVLDTDTTPANNALIDGNHMSCFTSCIEISVSGSNTTTMMHFLKRNLLFKRPDSTVSGFAHITGRAASVSSEDNYFYHGGSLNAVLSGDASFRVLAGANWVSKGDWFHHQGALAAVSPGATIYLKDGHVIDNSTTQNAAAYSELGTVVSFGMTGGRTNRTNVGYITQSLRPSGTSSAAFALASNQVNTIGKFTGLVVRDANTNLLMTATGPNPTSPWQPSDGGAPVTPA